MAEVSDLHARALQLIQSDPEATRIMQQQIHRLDPQGKTIPKSQLGDIVIDEKIANALKPVIEENAALKKQLGEKMEMDRHQAERAFMKKEYRMGDKELDELATWMKDDADGNLFKSYEAAHRYRQAMSQPTLPTGNVPPGKVSPLTRRAIGDEPWRENFRDPKHALRLSKSDAKAWAKEEWGKADREWLDSRK